jgi:nucleotide-binding universal stress UspA family protein
MYRNVLLCYDGTAQGRNALLEGADVAIAMRANAHLLAILRSTLHGVNVPEGITGDSFDDDDRAAKAILDQGVTWLRDRGVQAEGHIVLGDPLQVIGHCARELEVDLIVLGHQRQGRLARWWSDSECAALLDVAPCSVLVAAPEDTGPA